jgi:predicted aspartyl protease
MHQGIAFCKKTPPAVILITVETAILNASGRNQDQSFESSRFPSTIMINPCGVREHYHSSAGLAGTSMSVKGVKCVGKFSVDFDVANHVDILDAQRGLLAPDKVRRVRLSGVVDPGATKLVLPEKTVAELGLPGTGKVKVCYANHATARRATVKEAYVQIQGREGVFAAIVEPKRRTALIGAIVLEDLDLLVDCARQRLVPRDPHTVVCEIE